jgi:hypothetical protein
MSETTEVVGAVKEEIFSRLDLLAEKLGTTAEHVYPIMVKQQMVEEFTAILFTVVCTVVLLVAVYLFIKAFPTSNLDYSNYPNSATYEERMAFRKKISLAIAACIASGAIAAIFAIAWVIALAEVIAGIGKLINPEYYAIQEIIYFIK